MPLVRLACLLLCCLRPVRVLLAHALPLACEYAACCCAGSCARFGRWLCLPSAAKRNGDAPGTTPGGRHVGGRHVGGGRSSLVHPRGGSRKPIESRRSGSALELPTVQLLDAPAHGGAVSGDL